MYKSYLFSAGGIQVEVTVILDLNHVSERSIEATITHYTRAFLQLL